MPETATKSQMNRRSFLKLSGLALGLAAAAPMISAFDQFHVQAKIGKKIYRGTLDGKLSVLGEKSKTWEQIANFGNGFSIERIAPGKNGAVKIRLLFQGHTFWLQSKDDRVWYTINYQPVKA